LMLWKSEFILNDFDKVCFGEGHTGIPCGLYDENGLNLLIISKYRGNVNKFNGFHSVVALIRKSDSTVPSCSSKSSNRRISLTSI
jgi:hypothetical protein